MKRTFTSELLPMLPLNFCLIGKKLTNISSACYILILLFTFTILLTAQNITNPNLPDVYKNVYRWQEKENTLPTNDSILTVLGRWAWGACLAVDADSNYSYIGNGPTFHVLDISDPSTPTIIGEYLTEGYIYDIEIRDNIAFVCIGSGLLILDITNPTAPEEISFVQIGGGTISFALEGSFAYVTTWSGFMQVVDISDLNNPYKRGAIAAGGEFAFCVEAKDSYVYIGNPEWWDLAIVDATNPDTLQRTFLDIGGRGLSAYIRDTLLFLGVMGNAQFKIYNVTNAAAPEFVGQMQLMNQVEDVLAVTVSNDEQTAYLRSDSGNVYSVDISDLTHPEIKDKYEKHVGNGIGFTGIAFSNNSVLSAHYNGLLTLNASEPDSLIQQSFFPTGGFSEKIQVRDSIAYVACGLAGLWMIDISDLTKPKSVSNVNTGGFTEDLVIEDTLAYIVNWAAYSQQDTSRGLWIINISDIDNPIVLSHYIGITNYSDIPNSITKSDDIIFITEEPTSNYNILEVINVGNPYQPIRLEIFQRNYLPHNTSVKDSILYLATANRGLRIINISNPSNLVEVNSFCDSTNLIGIFVKDNFAYADRIDTLFILDISDPINPVILGKMGRNYGGFSSIDLFATDNFLYWAERYLGVVDISDKSNPIELTHIEGKDWGRGVSASGDKIFFADKTQGVWILKNDLITNLNADKPFMINQYELYQNYPNPFNPATAIEFTIPQREKVLIEVFDLLGQKIKTLLNEEVEEGKHKIIFNASGLSSGIYFYRMRTKETTITKKMVILR